jgi:hypothetical protein
VNKEAVKDKIVSILKEHPAGLGEYDLLTKLREQGQIAQDSLKNNLQLFQQHFLLMHCLYQLQEQLWQQDNLVLSVSPLNIRIEKSEAENGSEISNPANNELRDYYLDWNNYDSSEAKVDELLNHFWRDYARYLQRDKAWEILSLPIGAALKEVTDRYRELAAIHHPDKGGDQETFIKIRAAYESLRMSVRHDA